MMGRLSRWGVFIALFAGKAAAATSNSNSVLGINMGKGNNSLSVPMQIVIMLTLLTLLPAIVMSITPFLRIAIVLHVLRQALGTQTAPSNQVLVGISLFLTMLVIQPVAVEMYHEGWEPLQNNQMTPEQAFDAGSKPLKTFLVRFAREKDVKLFIELSQIGAVLFMPFLIIDLVVASVTLSVGMMQLPPVMISAPFKILLFVLADGWNLVIGSLVKGFYA
jgi:flagellar biosynthetic protein FliP